jgi:hypothetical protein
VPIFRYFWFMCAAVMGVNVIIWHRLLAERVTRGALTREEAYRFTRGAAFWLVCPCLVLGSIALAAGWSDPFCAGVLTFRGLPSAATSLVILALGSIFFGWLWLGRGATVLSRVGAALTDRPDGISPGIVRIAATGALVASGVGAVTASRQVPAGCAFADPAGSALPRPGLQIVFLGLFAATWLIGGNVLVAQHYRRMGKSPWSGFQPFAFPFKDFNAKEWLTLFALAVLSLSFGAIALSLNPQ